jgi:hypothetical protein
MPNPVPKIYGLLTILTISILAGGTVFIIMLDISHGLMHFISA